MPRAARYSVATKNLVAELAKLGHKVSCSTAESWANKGLAPRPRRIHMGRRGTESVYPDGALDQYAAVDSVMRTRRDWRIAGLMLIGRGFLPTEAYTTRLLLQYLFDGHTSPADPLLAAEEMVAEADKDPLFGLFINAMKDNLVNAHLFDSANGRPISPTEAASGASINMMAAMFGRQLPSDDAVTEVTAASGLMEPGISSNERFRRERFVEALLEDVWNFETLREHAEAVDLPKLQRTIQEMLTDAREFFPETLWGLPDTIREPLLVVFGLAATMVDDLGGDRWIDRAARKSR